MNSHFGTKRVSTRKSCTETSQLLAFLNTVIDSDTCKSLSHALGFSGFYNNVFETFIS